MKKICLWICILAVMVAIIFVGVGLVQTKTYNPQKPVATIEIEGYEKPIKIELDPQSAPNAVANFVKLANSGFYSNYKMNIKDGEIVVDSSMEKAKLSNIMENPENNYIYGIKGDFSSNGHKNLLKNEKGVITMLRNEYSYFDYTEEGYNSANSQFTILTEANDSYNGRYASFGKIVEGEDVLDAIYATKVEEKKDEDTSKGENEDKSTDTQEGTNTENNSEENQNTSSDEKKKDEDKKDDDTNKITIKSISVDTFGVDYGMPEYNNYETSYNAVNNLCKQYFGSDYESLFVR